MDLMHPQNTDHEAAMARADLFKCAQYSFKLFKMIHDGQQLDGWVQAKITKAADYIASVYHYMEYEMKFSEYGEQIENSDMYSESQKVAIRNMLTEAKKTMKKLTAAQAAKAKKEEKVKESWDDMLKAVKEPKGTGKFDKKELKPGVTQYTRKSSTFSDGGDSDAKAAKKKSKKTDEGIADLAKKAGGAIKKAGQKALNTLGHGSDEDLIKDLQKKSGVAQTGKKPMAVKNEAKKAKPDFLDMDKDGNKKEPMKKALADKKGKKVAEAKKEKEPEGLYSSKRQETDSQRIARLAKEKRQAEKKKTATEAYNPNSASAEHRRNMDQHTHDTLKAKATGPDATDADKARYQRYKDRKAAMRAGYNDRMER